MNCAVSGTFDPITNGHLDIIQRAAYIFDKAYAACVKGFKQGEFCFGL